MFLNWRITGAPTKVRDAKRIKKTPYNPSSDDHHCPRVYLAADPYTPGSFYQGPAQPIGMGVGGLTGHLITQNMTEANAKDPELLRSAFKKAAGIISRMFIETL